MHSSQRVKAVALAVLALAVFLPGPSGGPASASHGSAHTGSASIAEFPLPTLASGPTWITAGPDGNVWFTAPGTDNTRTKVARMTRDGAVTEFTVPGVPHDITAGPNGDLWFTMPNKIGRITTAGAVTEFAAPNGPVGITLGTDGNLWVTESNHVARLRPTGEFEEFPLPTPSQTWGITPGPDGHIWFTETTAKKIGRITNGGTITEFPITSTDSPFEIVQSHDGRALWFTEFVFTGGTPSNKIGRLTADGAFTEFSTPSAASRPTGIAAASDGNFYVSETSAAKIARVEPDGTIDEIDVPTANSNPGGIALAQDGRLWFTEHLGNRIGRVSIDLASFSTDPPAAGPGALFFPRGFGCTGPNAAITIELRDVNGAVLDSELTGPVPDGSWSAPMFVPTAAAPGVYSVWAQCRSGDAIVFGYQAEPFLVTNGRTVAIPPTRVLDTRSGSGHQGAGRTLGPQGTIDFVATAAGGLPTWEVAAAIMNITATNTTAASFLTVYPWDQARPLASNLNFVAGQTHPNLAVVPVSFEGRVGIYNNAGAADVIADVVGYVTVHVDGASLFRPQTAARIADSRPGSGYQLAGMALGQGQERRLELMGQGGVPVTGARAVALNVTVTNPTAQSHVTVFPKGFPGGDQRPNASNLNFVAGETVANRVIVPVGADGGVWLYNNAGTTDVVVDVSGWYGPAADASDTTGAFYPLTPSRIWDTRPNSGRSGQGLTIGPGGTGGFSVSGLGGVPSADGAVRPSAVLLNVTATNTTAASYFTVYPNGSPKPASSDLNWAPGVTIPNLVVTKIDSQGNVSVYNNAGNADLVVDVLGWIRQ